MNTDRWLICSLRGFIVFDFYSVEYGEWFDEIVNTPNIVLRLFNEM